MEPQYYAALAGILSFLWLLSYYLVPYFTTYRSLKHIPGPTVAKFSNLWIALGARQGQKYAWVDYAHRKYGKVVRVGYNHVSIATPEGLQTVYAHGNGFLKDHFYEAFVSGVPGVFNVRDRAEHTRKRKIVAHAFSPGAVHAFEPHMASNLQRWVAQLDKIAATATATATATTAAAAAPAGGVPLTSTTSTPGFADINLMPWCTFLAFDIIGDLAFGAPFGMVERGRDECESTTVAGGPPVYVPGAETLNRRGEVSSTIGLLLPIKPWAKYLPDPFFSKGLQSVSNLHGIAVAAVAKRLGQGKGAEMGPGEEPKEKLEGRRHDILDMLVHTKDSAGQLMPRNELIAEALTQLIAGSDTVSNTSCAVLYWILHGERAAPGTVLPRLLAELDAAIPFDEPIASFSQVRSLPFLRRCIDEGMRLHSTSALGLPRIVTTQHGIGYGEDHFPQGTVLSVPSFTIHHDADVWGADVDDFRPDRWLPARLTPRQRMCFNPFSYGPRACVGQNVAHMELALIVGTALHRYEFALYQAKLESHEGFSKKPLECQAGIRRRQRPVARPAV